MNTVRRINNRSKKGKYIYIYIVHININLILPFGAFVMQFFVPVAKVAVQTKRGLFVTEKSPTTST